MFKPSQNVQNCPICGEKLNIDEMDNFGLPVGYSAECPKCCKYMDIWINGLREVQCGDWESEAYESGYGNLSEEEKMIEKQTLKQLNRQLWLERIKYYRKKLPTLWHKIIELPKNFVSEVKTFLPN